MKIVDGGTMLDHALEAHGYGLCVVPPAQDGTKRPDVKLWKGYQKEPATAAEINVWYSQERTGLGLVTGAVSGNLEVLDFDDKEIYGKYRRALADACESDLLGVLESGYLEHSPNGAHWLYRCDEISGNLKLAQKRSGRGYKALIETRGEGGYIIIAPTYGDVNASGAYTMVNGGFPTIPTISPSDRKLLHNIARTFDEAIATATRAASGMPGEDRPGDEFEATTTWAKILEPHGWVRVYDTGDGTAWRRPGKDRGISATTDHDGSGLLYVFSTSTIFEANRGINKFAGHTILNHAGDFGAAAREIRATMAPAPVPAVEAADISGVLEQLDCGPEPDEGPREIPEHLLDVPGMVGDLAGFINGTSSRYQPLLALGASLAAVATIIGRKVQTDTGLRSNIYVLGVAETGAGKERARQAIREVFLLAGAEARVAHDAMASDAAILTAVAQCPSVLFLLDEIGRTMRQLARDNAPSHITSQIDVYLKLYGSSAGTCSGKSYADFKKQLTIEQPNLSIYGTTVPKRLYESMTSSQVVDGYLSRFLPFESTDPDPEYREVVVSPPPADLVKAFAQWENAPENGNPAAGNIAKLLVPEPRVVSSTPAAKIVFDDLEQSMRAKRKGLRDGGDDAGLYTRVATAARKLALIRAAGIRFDDPQIGEADATWACELALWIIDGMARRIELNVADNAQEAITKRVGEVIRRAGKRGLAQNELTRRTQWLRRQERGDIVATLQESGQVSVNEVTTGGPKMSVYRWIGKKRG